jgi:septin family protein
MAVLGSDRASMKANADEAHVQLSLEGNTYTRSFERRNGTVHTAGDPYLEDPILADLFAFLLSSNEARQAIMTDTDPRSLIMRPIDTDEIQAEIDRLMEQREQVSRELDELDELKRRLPKLEEERTRLEAEIEEKKAELRETEERLEGADADL